MKKKTILVDQDQVVYDFLGAVMSVLNNRGYNITRESFTEWDLNKCLGEEAVNILHEHPDEVYELGEPNTKLINLLEQLQEYYNIYIVTAAWIETIPYKFEWFKKHMSFISEGNIIIARNKGMIEGDFLIDDGIHNIKSFTKNKNKIGIFYRELLKNPVTLHGDNILNIDSVESLEKFFFENI